MKKQLLLFLFALLPMLAMADDSGSCGSGVTWTYTESTETLIIQGNGAMDNYDESGPSILRITAPWKNYVKQIKEVIIKDGVTNIGEWAFFGCSGLTSVTIPNSVTSIGRSAFVDCSGLTSITIGNSVTSIGDGAFRGCSGLTSITIPNSVTSIENEAFFNCSGLTSVTIGNEVTSIGNYAFAGCSGLQSVYSKVEDVFGINKNTFDTNTYSKAKLYVPVGKKAVYQDTPWWLSFTNIEEYDYSTGIAAQQMGKDVKVVDAYQLNGQKRNGVQRGLNIVRMSDGTTRKVVVK